MVDPGARPVGVLDVLVFIVELALLAFLAVAGARLGSSGTAIALAVLLPLVAAVLWGFFLAPRASRRLSYPRRLLAKLALIFAAAVLLTVSGAAVWGVVFLLIGGSVVAIGEVHDAKDNREGPR